MSNPYNQGPSTAIQVDQTERSIVVTDEMQNGLLPHAQSLIYSSQKIQDDLQALGLKIKEHESNIKVLKSQKSKLDESILNLQVVQGQYQSLLPQNVGNNGESSNQTEEETIEQILHHEHSAASIICQLKAQDSSLTSNLTIMNDVLGIVATLGKIDDDNLSRLLSEYLGVESMLAIVCKTYKDVKALETYDQEGHINKSSGLHVLGSSVGRSLDGRFQVFCLETLRPYSGDFEADDPERRLDLLKPKLPNGECPPGFIGFAVNMISVDYTHLYCLTPGGFGLRETLFYNLFSRLQVYKTRQDMLLALPCISDGAISLDGGMIKSTGVYSLGNRHDVNVRFPKTSVTTKLPEKYIEIEKELNEMKWRTEKVTEDLTREQELLKSAKNNFETKKQEFFTFLARSSTYVTQHQVQAARGIPPRC